LPLPPRLKRTVRAERVNTVPLSPLQAQEVKPMKTMLKIAGGIILAFVLLIAGCTALIGVGANEVQKESNEHAITRAQYRAIKSGMTRAQVEAKLGEPANDQDMNVSVEELSVASNTQCIYYNEKDEIVSMYQFCFDNGKLNSKARY
jgi:hypothetical protein